LVAAFDGGAITSDAGALLLGATDRAIRMVDRLASCFVDRRSPAHVGHSVATLVGQRIFAIALGYEDLNDHETLRHDPLMAVLAGKLEARRPDCAAVAGKSTLNRLELSKPEPSRYHKINYDAEAVNRLFVDLFLEAHRTAPARSPSISMPPMIRCMARRKGASFMATTNPIVTCRCIFFAGGTCFAPSSAGPTSTPARARLKRWRGSLRRSASVGPTYGFCCGADSGFTRDELMTWCEQNDVDYLFGLAKNNRLIAEIAAELAEAAEENRQSGRPSPALQGLPIEDAQELEPATPRRRQGRVDDPVRRRK
jgi:hypothetical protein